MIRVYHDHPLRPALGARTFGPAGRLDPHVRDRRRQPREAPDGRGAIYLATDLATALAEVFGEQRPQVGICPHTRAVWARPEHDVQLLDLTGDGAMAIGAVGTLTWGDEPRRRTQRWARRIYEQYARLGGVRYRTAHQGGEAVVLWDRAPRLHAAVGRRPGAMGSVAAGQRGARGPTTRAVANRGRQLHALRRCRLPDLSADHWSLRQPGPGRPYLIWS